MSNERKRLGEILIENRILQEFQLNAALADQTAFGGRLGSHLVRMGYVTEETVLSVLAHQLALPIINLRRSHIKYEALARVKKDMCLKHGLIPIARRVKNGAQTLLIAMSDPTDYAAVQAVEFASGCRVTVAIASERDIYKFVNFCYTDEGPRESHGEADLHEALSVNFGEVKPEDAVLFTAEGVEKNLTSDGRDNPALRALVELLIRKNVITSDEFHKILEEFRGA